MGRTITRTPIRTRNGVPILLLVAAVSYGYAAVPGDFHYLYTFGSKQGIHPPRLLNRRAVIGALGAAEHPYGLAHPIAVATDMRHRVWITDGTTASVHVFDPASGAYREIKRAGDVPLQQPWGIVADAAGRIYVVDSGTGGIYVFDENGEYDRSLFRRDEHPLQAPTVIALSEDGRTIYVADPPRNVVVAFNREGEVDLTLSLPEEMREPTAISVINNQLYVLGSRQHRVEIFSPTGRPLGDLRWDGVLFPTAFAFDPAQRRFLVANPKWSIVQTFTEEGLNTASFGHLGEGVDQTMRIDSLHVDPRGLVYVVDTLDGKVVVFSETETH